MVCSERSSSTTAVSGLSALVSNHVANLAQASSKQEKKRGGKGGGSQCQHNFHQAISSSSSMLQTQTAFDKNACYFVLIVRMCFQRVQLPEQTRHE